MTQEEKELLLKDLCARLPQEVILLAPNGRTICVTDSNTAAELFVEEGWKPYLRPMSSMTEEEYDQLYIDSRVKEDSIDILDALANDMDAIDWLNKNHFDYRGLIERNLAIEVTKENNPYGV